MKSLARALFALALTSSLTSLPSSGQAVASSSQIAFAPASDAAIAMPQEPAVPMATKLQSKSKTREVAKPFSRLAFGAGVSPLGIGFQIATNVNSHLNLRGTGNVFNYTASNINTSGFNVDAKLNFASAGFSADIYPFHAGFRLSPGVLFYNQNSANATFTAQPGTSFTLNNTTYYSASGANAVTGVGTFGLGNGSPAFTLTTGWGNMTPAHGHWSFPFEIGVAFTQDPTVNLTLTGLACNAQGQNCINIATDPTAQANLQAQVKSYQSDINPLKTYPIVSIGVAYSFHLRK